MAEHTINLSWERTSPDFDLKTYDRTHTIKFSGGTTLKVSAAKEYLGNPYASNPEELMITALSSCHMMTFLAIAANQGFIVDSYQDEATGSLEKNTEGKIALTRVALRPRIQFEKTRQPDAKTLLQMHEKAHANCIIANSVKTEITITPA